MQINEAGEISGWAARYGGAPDSHGDQIQPNACAETVARAKSTGRYPAMLLQHGMGDGTVDGLPIGQWYDLEEGPSGLFAKGRLILDNSRARDVWSLIRARVLDGLSVGYVATRFQIMPRNSDGIRRKLISIDVREISCVVNPSHVAARIQNVKSDADDKLKRALERLAISIRRAA
jgi:Escherichia/Staphylococcus phage prohead protease